MDVMPRRWESNSSPKNDETESNLCLIALLDGNIQGQAPRAQRGDSAAEAASRGSTDAKDSAPEKDAASPNDPWKIWIDSFFRDSAHRPGQDLS